MNIKDIIAAGSIVTLAACTGFLALKNKQLKEFTSEEKMCLFNVGVELALDNLKLQKTIDEMKKEA